MDTLFRRRVIALGLLFFFIAVVSIFQNSNYTLWGVINNSGNHGVYAAGNPYTEWVYIDCNGEEQQVTILQNGELRGIDGIDDLREVQFPNHCSLPMVDHPSLESWQQQLDTLKGLTSDNNADAEKIVETALQLQLSSLYVEPISQWLDASPQHPKEFIDAMVSELPKLARGGSHQQPNNDFTEVFGKALDTLELDTLDAATMEDWLYSEYIGENSDILVHLSDQDYQDVKVASVLLKQSEHVDRRDQSRFYLNLAKPLAPNADFAADLRSSLAELNRNDRGDIVMGLLNERETNIEFAKEVLADFDDLIYGNQAEVETHQLLAQRLKDEPAAPRLLTRVLQDMDDRERRIAAVNMIEMDSTQGVEFIQSILNDFDVFHPDSREYVAEAVIRSEEFAQIDIQAMLFDAVDLEMEGDKQRNVLQRMLRSGELDDEVKFRVERLL